MSDKTGGPAFPNGPGGDSWHHEDGRVSHQWPAHPGMDLLDWFAGQALAGLLSDTRRHGDFDAFASDTYHYADAMLAEKARREATGKDGLQVPDHSPDAGKMAKLEEENRELAEALIRCVRLLEVLPDEYVHRETGNPLSHSPDGALSKAIAVIEKHQASRSGGMK